MRLSIVGRRLDSARLRDHPAAYEDRHFDAPIFLPPRTGGVVCHGVGHSVTGRNHDSAQRNVMLFRQVLRRSLSSLTAQTAVKRLIAFRRGETCNFDDKALMVLGLTGYVIEVPSGFGGEKGTPHFESDGDIVDRFVVIE